MQLLIYFFIAIGLSMDAFSLATAYGTTNISKYKEIILSIIVGIFHFIMPYLGSRLGVNLLKNLSAKANLIAGIVFLILAIDMFIKRNEEEKGTITNTFSMILFAFTVSLDSFSVGIALSLTESNIIIPCLIFSVTSFFFTLIGLLLGKKLNNKYGNKATYIGTVLLLILAIKYLFN